MRIARSRRALGPLAGSRRRAAVAAASFAAAIAVTAPIAHAEPATPAPSVQQDQSELLTPQNTPELDKRVLDSLGAFAPALIGSAATRGADGKVNAKLLADARAMADNPLLPAEVADTWRQLIDFLAAPDAEAAAKVKAAEAAPGRNAADREKKAYEIPKGPNAPKIQQFLYPTAGYGCTPGGLFHLGMALVTAGPQEAPAPGPKRGEAGFVFTSLGTGPAVNNKRAPLLASWINIDTGKQGVTTLKRNEKINVEEGPGTFTGIAKTGKGRIIATIHGTVTTKNDGKYTACGIAPTIGTAII
ncbi:Rv1157c family protein [Gordonia iterans]